MSAVTNQPLPFGRLEREKHIEMIFRAFQNRCGASCECHVHSPRPKLHYAPSRWESHEELPDKKNESKLKRSLEKKLPIDAQGMDFLSILDLVEQIHITATPELQGKIGCRCWICIN